MKITKANLAIKSDEFEFLLIDSSMTHGNGFEKLVLHLEKIGAYRISERCFYTDKFAQAELKEIESILSSETNFESGDAIVLLSNVKSADGITVMAIEKDIEVLQLQ